MVEFGLGKRLEKAVEPGEVRFELGGAAVRRVAGFFFLGKVEALIFLARSRSRSPLQYFSFFGGISMPSLCPKLLENASCTSFSDNKWKRCWRVKNSEPSPSFPRSRSRSGLVLALSAGAFGRSTFFILFVVVLVVGVAGEGRGRLVLSFGFVPLNSMARA